MFEQFVVDFQAILETFKNRLIELLPNLVAALVIIIAGIVVARILRFILNRFLKNVGRLMPHPKLRARLEPERLEKSALLVSNIFYWVVLFFFLTAATETLGLPVVTTWLSGVALYLPRILLAALIVVAGLVGGMIVRELIATGAASVNIAHAAFLGKLSQYALVIISILVAVDEVGIDITVLTNVITLVIAALLFAAALGFALGSQVTIGNIIASYYVHKQYKVGQTIAIDGVEGTIVEITPTAVVIESNDGVVYVPAKRFNEVSSRKVSKQ